MSRLPALFVGHGAPTLALDAKAGAPLAAWGRELPKPKALLVVSAHWEARAPTLGTITSVPLLYDFGGFPEPLYHVKYAAPPAPALAPRVLALLEEAGLGPEVARNRPWDHGVWTPLVHLFPAADVPLLQLSLVQGASPSAQLALGRALAPLRDEGVLVVGSGQIVHNLRLRRFGGGAPEAWARDFDAFVAGALERWDLAALEKWRDAPGAETSVPSDEHLAPLLVACGAADGPTPPKVRFTVREFELGNLSRLSAEFT